MTEFEQILAEEKQALDEALQALGVHDGELRQEAAVSIDLGAKILSAKLTGQDTKLAEQSLRARYLNLKSATSTVVAGTLIGALEGAVLRMAGRITKILIAL